MDNIEKLFQYILDSTEEIYDLNINDPANIEQWTECGWKAYDKLITILYALAKLLPEVSGDIEHVIDCFDKLTISSEV